MECRICGNQENNTEYTAREMMMGLRTEFRYFQCARCNCLQIAEFPNDISRYYPDDYYSLQDHGAPNFITRIIKRIRNHYAVFNRPFFGKFLYEKYPEINLRSLSHLSLDKEMRILDVGCGTGDLLHALSRLGFSHLTGIDPFNKKEIIEIDAASKIYRKDIYEVSGTWDLIMMHHVFEHMKNPLQVLKRVSDLLAPGGHFLVRIPVTESEAWQTYRENWVQLDPPRHFFVHSPQSMQHLVNQTDLEIEKTVYDSTAFQFWGSIQYVNDIPLHAANSYAVNPEKSMFSAEDIQTFSEKAQQLNEQGEGDQAIFILKKLA